MPRLETLSEMDITRNGRVFEVTTESYGENGWPREHQFNNFGLLAEIAKLSGKPFKGTHNLDVGCGTGDLSVFLKQQGARGYFGIDLLEPFITTARKRYPKERFLVGDFLAADIDEEFDFAFCSGALGVAFSSGNWRVAEAVLTKMLDLSRVGIAFNFISDLTPPAIIRVAKGHFFYDIDRMTNMCRVISGGGKVTSVNNGVVFGDTNNPGEVIYEVETTMWVVKPPVET